MADIKYITLIKDEQFQKTFNDIEFDATNDVVSVYGEDYANQAIAKALMSKQNRTSFFPTYGTELDTLRFYNLQDPVIQRALVDTITGSIIYLDTIETSNIPDERIKSIDNIELVPMTGAPTTIKIRLYLTLRSNKKLKINVGG